MKGKIRKGVRVRLPDDADTRCVPGEYEVINADPHDVRVPWYATRVESPHVGIWLTPNGRVWGENDVRVEAID